MSMLACSRCNCEFDSKISAMITTQAKYMKISPLDDGEFPNVFALCPRCYIALDLFMLKHKLENEDELVNGIAESALDDSE